MDYSPDDVARRFIAAEEGLSSLIGTVRPDLWDAPSPCEDWAARDVVAHVIDTQRDFLARFQITLGEPTPADAAPPAAWRAHVEAVRPVVTDPEFVATPFDGYFGPTTIGDTLVRFYVGDMIVHRWDLARAVGGDDVLTEDEMDLLEANFESYGDAAYADGVFRGPVPAADDADRATRLLAKMGRSA
jgi:uncharacterized protein (TIGR03086 family)